MPIVPWPSGLAAAAGITGLHERGPIAAHRGRHFHVAARLRLVNLARPPGADSNSLKLPPAVVVTIVAFQSTYFNQNPGAAVCGSFDFGGLCPIRTIRHATGKSACDEQS